MHSSISRFFFFYLFVLLFNPKNMLPLLLSSFSGAKLFELHSLPHGDLIFLGDSHMKHNEIALTKEGMPANGPKSAGVVLYRHPILFLDPSSKKVRSFYTMFAFSIQSIDGVQKAFGDGLAFLISPKDDLLGSPGYLGLVDSTNLTRNKFIAIEFDTRCDSMFQDPDDNHVALDINSLFSVKLAASSSLGVNLKNGGLIGTWINYRSNDKRLEVFVSDSGLKPKKPLLNIEIDLSKYIKENMFVGFSAATERSMPLVRIHQWEFTVMEFNPPPPPPPSSPLDSRITFPNPSESRHAHSHLSKYAICITLGVCFVSFIVVFGWFCWQKLMGMIQKSGETSTLEMQTITSSGGISCLEILLLIIVDKVAKGINTKKVLNHEAELIHVKATKSSILLCSSLPAVKPSTLPHCNNLPLRTNNSTSV